MQMSIEQEDSEMSKIRDSEYPCGAYFAKFTLQFAI